LTKRGELDPLAHTVKEQLSEFFLQGFDASAQGGLRDEKHF
jgi:hypothetical protein